jgi:MarR family transcriptional regulator, organic hydroperoxide resistance regulator
VKTQLNTEFGSAHESPGFLLWRASNKLQRQHRAALKDHDLTPSQFSVLATLAHFQGPGRALRQSELGDHTQIDKMLVSDLIRTLTAKKYVVRKPDSNDARAVLVTITNAGLDRVNGAITVVESIDRQFFSQIENSGELLKMLQLLAAGEERAV